jgi:hypothetical protein
LSTKLWVGLILCASLCVASCRAVAQGDGFPNLGNIGPSKAEVAGAIIGAAAVITLVVYFSVPKQKTIEGCVESANGVSVLTNEKDHRIYALVSNTVAVTPGQRLKLKGKKRKDKSGDWRFEVKKLIKAAGPCGS